MGNLPSIFCPSESNSQCIGQDSLFIIPTSSIGVMLTPSESHVLTHDALQDYLLHHHSKLSAY